MKTVKRVLLLLALLTFATILASCDIGGGHEHTPGTAVTENKVNATCCVAGSYDKVVYCTDCGKELSRETVTEGYDETTHEFTKVHNDLSEKGLCGGYIDYQCCKLCGVCEEMDAQTDCSFKSVTVEGKTKTVCSVCGAEIKEESTSSQKDKYCRVVTTASVIFVKDGEEVAHIDMKEAEYQHNDTVTYEKLGETCQDGYRRIATCKDCGRKAETEQKGHETETITLLLAEKGMCGGEICYDVCQVCGEVTNYVAYLDDSGCHWDCTGVDSDGYQTSVCTVCGAIWSEKLDEEEPVNCQAECTHATRLYYNGIYLFNETTTNIQEDHNYKVTYTKKGESCEDGWIATYTCADCRDTFTEEGNGHVFNETDTDFEDYGMCGGMLMVNRCAICGELYGQNGTSPIQHYTLCNYQLVETTSDGYEKSLCSTCGAVLYEKKTKSAKDEHCNVTVSESIRIEKDGEVIAKAEGTYVMADHEYEYVYTMRGATCENGYNVAVTCKNCDFTKEYEDYYHRTEKIEVNFADYGMCGGSGTMEKCIVCGEITDFTCYPTRSDCQWGATEITSDGYEKRVCDICGAVWKAKETTGKKDENCYADYREEVDISMGATTVFHASANYVLQEHNYGEPVYSKNGETCEDGWTATYTCLDCGYIHTVTGTGHAQVEEDIDFAKLGLCGGYGVLSVCANCDEVIFYNVHPDSFDCDWGELETTEDGFEKRVCNVCGAIWLQKENYGEKDENCGQIYTKHTILKVDGNTVFDEGMSYIFTDHNYEPSYKLKGATCEDGWILTYTCSGCHTFFTEEGTGHAYESEYTYFEDFGMCGGELRVDYCAACGALTNRDNSCPIYHQTFCDYQLVETTSDGYEKSVCSDCGAVLYHKRTELSRDNRCNATVFESIRIEKDGEVIAKAEGTYVMADHEYEYAYVLKGATCDEGYTVTVTCKNCDYTAEFEDQSHRTKEVNVNFADYGMCDGSGMIDVCTICGKITYYNCYPEWGDCEWGTMEITSDGYEKRVCSVCGAVWQYKDTEGEKGEKCLADGQEEILITMGTTVVFHATCDYISQFHNYGDPVYTKNGETCADGWVVAYTCLDCGYVYTEEGWGHSDKDTGIDFAELGLCGGEGSRSVCAVCGEKTGYYCHPETFDCKWGEPEITTDGFEKRVCSECGAIWLEKDTIGEKDENCNQTNTTHTILKVDGNTVFDEEMNITSIDHAFTETYESYGECKTDGWKVTYTCDDCGYSYTDTGYYHQYQWETVCEETETTCGITMELYRCHFCKELYDSYWAVDLTTNCNFENGKITEDGYRKYVCPTCGAVKYEKTTESQPDTDGKITCTQTLKFQLADTTLYELTRTYRKHDKA